MFFVRSNIRFCSYLKIYISKRAFLGIKTEKTGYIHKKLAPHLHIWAQRQINFSYIKIDGTIHNYDSTFLFILITSQPCLTHQLNQCTILNNFTINRHFLCSKCLDISHPAIIPSYINLRFSSYYSKLH